MRFYIYNHYITWGGGKYHMYAYVWGSANKITSLQTAIGCGGRGRKRTEGEGEIGKKMEEEMCKLGTSRSFGWCVLQVTRPYAEGQIAKSLLKCLKWFGANFHGIIWLNNPSSLWERTWLCEKEQRWWGVLKAPQRLVKKRWTHTQWHSSSLIAPKVSSIHSSSHWGKNKGLFSALTEEATAKFQWTSPWSVPSRYTTS